MILIEFGFKICVVTKIKFWNRNEDDQMEANKVQKETQRGQMHNPRLQMAAPRAHKEKSKKNKKN